MVKTSERSEVLRNHVNSLTPSVDYTIHLTKILILKCEGIVEKIRNTTSMSW